MALPRDVAFDFLVFCLRNPKPCPLVEVLDPGDPEPKSVAPGADVRRDIPKYRVWRGGELAEEVDDISPLWTHDMVVRGPLGAGHAVKRACQAVRAWSRAAHRLCARCQTRVVVGAAGASVLHRSVSREPADGGLTLATELGRGFC